MLPRDQRNAFIDFQRATPDNFIIILLLKKQMQQATHIHIRNCFTDADSNECIHFSVAKFLFIPN